VSHQVHQKWTDPEGTKEARVVKNKLVEISVWICVGILIGCVWQASVYLPREQALERSLKRARKDAGSCYGLVSDHWRSHHKEWPLSEEIERTASDLSQDYIKLAGQ